MSNAHPGRIIPQDIVAPDGSGESLTALPVSQSEIDDLLYGVDRPVHERVERLNELAASLRDLQPGDFGDQDPRALIGEIEEAIARLSGGVVDDAAAELGAMDDDPLAHRETLAPDSDELEALEEEDEASMSEDAVLDPAEWEDGDGFDADRGVK